MMITASGSCQIICFSVLGAFSPSSTCMWQPTQTCGLGFFSSAFVHIDNYHCHQMTGLIQSINPSQLTVFKPLCAVCPPKKNLTVGNESVSMQLQQQSPCRVISKWAHESPPSLANLYNIGKEIQNLHGESIQLIARLQISPLLLM